MSDAPGGLATANPEASVLIAKLFDAAVVLGFASGTAYLVGYAYYWSYLTRLSLRPAYVQVGSMEYMWLTFMSLLLVTMLMLPAAFVAGKQPTTFVAAAIGNLPVFVFTSLMALAAVDELPALQSWLLLSNAAFFAILTLYRSYQYKSLAYFVYSGSTLVRAVTVASAAFLTLLVAFQLGTVHAGRLIEGSLYATCSVTLNGSAGKSLLGPGTWILVLVDESNYVVVQKSVPAADFPSVRLVSKNLVSVASVQRLQ